MLGSPQPRIAPTSASTMTPSSANSGLSPGIANNSTLSAFLPPRIPIFWFTVKVYRLILRLFPRLSADTDNSVQQEMDSGNPSAWRFQAGSALGSNGYGSAMGTGIEMNGYGSTGAGKRGNTAAQFVGGAWNGTPVGWGSNPGSRNGTPTLHQGNATPPTSLYTPPISTHGSANGNSYMNAAQSWSGPTAKAVPPPPKGARKKKD
jgi:etoposide-induced 2.4 mRNA